MTDRDIVLIHGGHHGAWCWDDVTSRMRAIGYRGAIHAPDAPGCGDKRARPTARMTLQEVAAELNSEIESTTPGNALLVGHAMAGVVLPLMVQGRPDLYSEVCYLAAPIPRFGECVRDVFGAATRGVDQTTIGWPASLREGRIEFLTEIFSPDMDSRQLELILRNAGLDNWPDCGANEKVERPRPPASVTIDYIVAERDPLLPAAWQGRFAERVNADHMYSIDTPHEPFITHVEDLADLLVDISRRAR